MAKRSIKAGTTSQREYVFVNDSASTTGAGKTGIAFNASGIRAYYVRPGGSATAITLATQTVTGAFSSGGWVEVDATNMPGVYRFDVPDAVFAAGVEKAIVMVSGASGMAPVVMEYDLTAYDPYDTVRLGLTALPNVASGSAGALITSGTGTAQLSVSSGAVTVGGYASGQTPLQPTVPGRTLDVSAGGEAGIDFANIGSPTTTVNLSGTTISTSQTVASVTNRVTANTDQLAGQTVTAAAGVTFPTSVASPTNITSGTITTVGTVTNRVTANTDQWGGVVVTGMPMPTYTQPTGFLAATFPGTVSSLTAAGVWQTDVSGYTTAGQAGTYLKGAGSSGDPWSSALPGSYAAGTAGYIVGTNLNATVSSRLASSSYTAPLDAAGVRSAVGLASANLDTQLGDLPTAAENADAVWDEVMSGHTTAGTYGGRIPRSDSSNVEVKITGTGSGHIAADVHAFQPGVFDSTVFATGALDSNALATSAANEIATAVYTGQMTESYRAAGVAPTLAQSLFELMAHMGDSAISGTTKTLKKIDGTAAKTFTLDSATAPTSITEAT